MTDYELDYAYYNQVKTHASYLHYYTSIIDAEAINAATNKIIDGLTTGTERPIIDEAENLRSRGLAYVAGYLGEGKTYPKNTNFNLFITNNSFERADFYGWSIDGSYTADKTGVFNKSKYSTADVDGTYLFYTKESNDAGRTLLQELKGLPSGSYSISAKFATKGDALFSNANKTYLNIDINGVKDTNAAECKGTGEGTFNKVSKTFSLANEESIVKIRVEGNTNNRIKTYYRADDFNLIYTGSDVPLDLSNYESEESFPLVEGEYKEVKSRKFAKTGDSNKTVWNTVCLPYNCEVPLGVEAMKLSSIEVTDASEDSEKAEDVKMIFEGVGIMEAGFPYLVKSKADSDFSLDASNVDVKNELDPQVVIAETRTGSDYHYEASMIGSFVKTVIPANSYFVRSGTEELWFTSVQIPMKGYRAYFSVAKVLDTIDEVEPVNSAKLRMTFETSKGEEITNIDGVNVESHKVPDVVCDLAGRRISKPSNGLYIVNGKKYIIK